MNVGDLVMHKHTGRLGIVEGFGRVAHVEKHEPKPNWKPLVHIQWADDCSTTTVNKTRLEVICAPG